MVQWLRLCAPNAGDLCPIPGQGTRSSMPQLRPRTVKKINIGKKKMAGDDVGKVTRSIRETAILMVKNLNFILSAVGNH